MDRKKDYDIARSIHKKYFAFDAHCDSLQSVLRGERSLQNRAYTGHLDFPRMEEGGVKGQVFACGLHVFGQRSPVPTEVFLRLVDIFYSEVVKREDVIFVRSADDLNRAQNNGKKAAILGMEDAEPVAGYLSLLRVFFLLGLRNLGLVWGDPNCIGTGVSTGEPDSNGLTSFGKEVVKECNRLGIVIDVAHINKAGFWNVLELTDDPIINSHANSRALFDHPRNMDDKQVEAIAENGGVINVVFTFLHEDPSKNSLESVIDHIDYIANLVGIEHVGIGSDFDGVATLPYGLKDASDYYKITAALLKRGYKESDIAKIIGGNLIRVYKAVLPQIYDDKCAYTTN